MAPLKVAIVGAGLMGGWHARAAARAGGHVVAIADLHRERAEILARRHGSSACASLDEALACAPDIVHLCTSLASHAPLAHRALDAAVHVVVEKPAAETASEARALVDKARERRRLLVPVHQLPFQRGVKRLASELASLGDLVHAGYRARTAGAEGRDADGRRAVMLEMLPHAFSLLRAIAGPTVTPSAFALHALTTDYLVLGGSAGATTHLAVSISVRGRPPVHELLVEGTRGTAWVDLFHGYATIERGGASRGDKLLRPFRRSLGLLAAAGGNLALRAARREPAYPGLGELIAATYAAVRNGAPAPITAEELVGSVALVEAVRSAAPAPRG